MDEEGSEGWSGLVVVEKVGQLREKFCFPGAGRTAQEVEAVFDGMRE